MVTGCATTDRVGPDGLVRAGELSSPTSLRSVSTTGRVRGTRPCVDCGYFKTGKLRGFSRLICIKIRFPSDNDHVTFYRRDLPHLQRDDYKPHFVTFVTKNRRILPDWARQIVLDCCMHDHEKRYNLRVAVVMPDHVHLILTPLTDGIGRRIFPLPEIMKAIKGTSSHTVSRWLDSHEAIWQEETFDHVQQSDESLDAKDCLHTAEPSACGVVSVANEYPWSWRKPAEIPYAPTNPLLHP